jgi:Zn-dependent peptidase ImmA (M78 family)
MSVRRKLVRDLTSTLLAQHNIVDAPVDVERLAKAEHVDIRKERVDGDISGFLFRDRDKSTAIIGVNSRHHANRQRFTIAHELGHFMLHTMDQVHVDRGFEVRLRNDESSKGTDTDEKEANLFAAELLMPKTFLEKDLANIESVDLMEEKTIKSLAEKYQVSTHAFAFRLAYLGYVQQ